MFTGIVEEVGIVRSIQPGKSGARLTIDCKEVLTDAVEGCSIAVNGVCLTALDPGEDSFSADLAPETLRRSNLGDLTSGSRVNLERPLLATSRLSGHIVQGHIDATAELVAMEMLDDENWWLRLRLPEGFERYFVEKGSIAIDGVSLTIAAIQGREIAVAIIPHTYANTALGSRRVGDRLNIEVDVIAKHVEKLLASRS